jgi:hypothetical protein
MEAGRERSGCATGRLGHRARDGWTTPLRRSSMVQWRCPPWKVGLFRSQGGKFRREEGANEIEPHREETRMLRYRGEVSNI